jgi:aryl-alcohol dehydrogenase-like predicted oxidoreductase
MGLGAWAWGDRPFWNYGKGYNDEDIAEAFGASLEACVNLVDTAEIYGTGRSEQLLGSFIKHTNSPVIVATSSSCLISLRNNVVPLRGSLNVFIWSVWIFTNSIASSG